MSSKISNVLSATVVLSLLVLFNSMNTKAATSSPLQSTEHKENTRVDSKVDDSENSIDVMRSVKTEVKGTENELEKSELSEEENLEEKLEPKSKDLAEPPPETIKVFTVATIKKASYLYLPNKTTVPVSTIYATTNIYSVKRTSDENYYELVVGQKKYWINASNLVESKKVPPKINSSLVRSFKTASYYTIFNKAGSGATALMRGRTVDSFKSVDVIKGYYVIDFGSKKGYIPFKHTSSVIKSNQKVEVVSSAKFYETVKRKKVAMGTFKRGTVLRIASSNSSTVTFKSGSRNFTLDKKAVIPTSNAESFAKLTKAVYPITLKAETAATIYSTSKKPVGTMVKGKSVSLLELSGNYGAIEYAGKKVYVKLNQFKHNNLVNPKKNISAYRYSYYLRVINQLYPEFTKLEKIGSSVEKRPIYALKLGTGKKEILMDGGIHAREHMTTNVLMEMIDQYSVSYYSKKKFNGYNTRAILNKTSIWFIPMVNPDGVTLVQSGIKKMQPKNQKIIKSYNKSTNYKRWKANGRGVDLNRNFDAIWKLQSYTPKSFMGYKGPSAFSEPESKAVRNFVLKHKFKTNYSYHSSGQVIYWFNFQNKTNYAKDLKLVNRVSKITGYTVVAPKYNSKGSGSSADWFIRTQKQPGFTMEIAPYAGMGPVSYKYWNGVWAKNKTIGLFGANEASSR